MRGCICPHPPLLIPEIGRENRDAVKTTIAAMELLSRLMGEPQTLVVISPHTAGFNGAHAIKIAPTLWGDFSAFNSPHVGREFPCDTEFAETLLELANDDSAVHIESSELDSLDHGALVPLSFLNPQSVVSLSVVASYEAHLGLGRLVRRCAESLGRDNLVFVASGDLSHRLTPSAPAGFDPAGHVFDDAVVELLSAGDFDGLLGLDRQMIAAAGECGLRSLIALGAFLGDDAAVDPRVLSYEGPFGVGYLVGLFGQPAAP